MSLCRHCGIRQGCEARGLCRHCYDDPCVRSQYPALDDGRSSNWEGILHAGRAFDMPTPARPGTPEKVAVLERRAEQGLFL